ncbi:MAG: DUF1467 family protein [Defluviicoccus sp.]|nr:DUF1467 family protein [Defluviicoccus sp.]MDG4608822.1 DUF1467 family protein [Defluviicoccus sp.]
MNVWTGIAVYIVIWWVVIFMVLPWGVRPLEAEDIAKGHASGAPRQPRILTKMAVTTVIAALIWVGVYFLIDSGAISFRE